MEYFCCEVTMALLALWLLIIIIIIINLMV